MKDEIHLKRLEKKIEDLESKTEQWFQKLDGELEIKSGKTNEKINDYKRMIRQLEKELERTQYYYENSKEIRLATIETMKTQAKHLREGLGK